MVYVRASAVSGDKQLSFSVTRINEKRPFLGLFVHIQRKRQLSLVYRDHDVHSVTMATHSKCQSYLKG